MSGRVEQLADGKVALHSGDCRAVLATLAADSIDACVTDPPYHLTSIVKRFGADNAAPAKSNGATGVYARASSGFMNCKWDGGEIAFEPETWAAVLRVLKPGAHLCAFGAPKNFGFMQVAIAQAGFEIRDVIAWMFGSGFPKSHNIGDGFGTALKPAYEPVILARKPLSETTIAANVAQWGTGALNIDACRVGTDVTVTLRNGNSGGNGAYGRDERVFERENPPGRWPANVITDGSDEVVGAFPESAGQQGLVRGTEPSNPMGGAVYGSPMRGERPEAVPRNDSGSAARFFYTAKADADDRLGSKHPTVKPLDLMQYLCRLVTPPRGLVLDCFAGTGTTGEACIREGMRAVLIEREEEYQEDIRRRMKLAMSGPDERAREAIKAKLNGKPLDHGPLFGAPDESRGGGASMPGDGARASSLSPSIQSHHRTDRAQEVTE